MIQADHPWKEACEKKLALVFQLLFPDVHEAVDWSRDTESLDQELRKHSPASLAGGRIGDRLIQAFARDSGDPRYYHLEVQGKKERGFRRRIHLCNLRVEERFNAHIVSLVLLTDRNPKWRPSRYIAGQIPIQPRPKEKEEPPAEGGQKKRRQRYKDERTLRWLTVKLIDFRGREAELEAMDNPMGLFVVAHLEAMRTRRDAEARQQVKLRLLRNLRQRKMDVEDARFWATCLDWFLQLSKERELAVRQEIERLDKEQNVPYLSFFERYALEQGREEGTLKTLGWYLETKYGKEALGWLSAVQGVRDEAALQKLCEQIFAADSAEKIRSLLGVSSNGDASQG